MPNSSPKSGHLVTFINYLVIASLIIIFVVLGGIVVLRLKDPVVKSLTQPKPITTTTTVDPDVISWTPYENTTFNFSIDVPDGWKSVDYSSFYNSGGLVMAFSPDELPCSTCSYLNNGYFSVRVYNQTTDPALFNLYTEKVKKADNSSEYKKVLIDGKTGLLSANTMSVENGGWIYDISLDKNNGQDVLEDSAIMKHILNSFKFTSLFTPQQ